MQLGPQKLTMAGRPRSDARSNGVPSSVLPTIAGAGCPRPRPDATVPFWPASHAAATVIATVAVRARPRATRIGRRRGSMWTGVTGAYLTVRVPVMFGIGWTLQMKVYVPASRGWNW